MAGLLSTWPDLSNYRNTFDAKPFCSVLRPRISKLSCHLPWPLFNSPVEVEITGTPIIVFVYNLHSRITPFGWAAGLHVVVGSLVHGDAASRGIESAEVLKSLQQLALALKR